MPTGKISQTPDMVTNMKMVEFHLLITEYLKQTIESSFPYYGMSKEYDRFAAFYLNAQYTFR